MKTHIVHIQTDDSLRQAVVRLPATAGDRAVLVWPVAGGPQPVEAALQFILRREQRHGQQLAIASPRRELALAAGALGLPTFTSPEEAGKADWIAQPQDPRPSPAELRNQATARRQLPQPLKHTGRLAWFALGLLAILLTAAWLLGLRA